jgi:N-acetylmuramoyl-L-alanine amidase
VRKMSMKSMMRALVLCAALATAVAAASPAALARGGLQGVKIFIDPGHGGPEPGAIGPSGLRESDVNLRVATALRNCLVEYGGATVKMSRTGDVDVSLGERLQRQTYWGADRFISIHHNASYNRSYNATETYAYTYADWTALDLRNKVHRRLVAASGFPTAERAPRTSTSSETPGCLRSSRRRPTSAIRTRRHGSRTWVTPGARGTTFISASPTILAWRPEGPVLKRFPKC